ncbi:hypothetical protein SAY87_024319 [Trapa incisa]|uniref:CG-1 domain-containing protein n=1 Tax=Trapa incisa TaxID=236973 RepID=A0AAN7GCL3_9MYRT|nr:hypothetical protein SAY87_024319 [Trapa incisa]
MASSGNYRYNMNDLYREAQSRWLKPAEVLYILQNHEDYHIAHGPAQRPPGGSLFLFNKRVVRFFRRDGHKWRKKKDQNTVGEAHEHLKVGNVETLNCYYAHGEENPNFQRRSYWMLDPAYEHIVLVHYRDINEGKSRRGPIASSSPSTPSNPDLYSIKNSTSISIISEGNESHHNFSSPGSTDVSSEMVFKNNVTGHSAGMCQEELSNSPSLDIEALERLKEQLNLNDDIVEELELFTVEDENSNYTGFLVNETETFRKDQHLNLMDDPGYSVKYQFSDGQNGLQDNLSNYMVHQGDAGGCGAGEWTDLLESYPRRFSSNGGKMQETYAYQLSDSTINDEILGTPVTYLDDYSHLFDEIPSSTVAQVQRYTIKEISPQRCYSNDATKVIIVGSFLCNPSMFCWTCMFDDVEVPLEIVQDGILSCEAPLHLAGKVQLCITNGNQKVCSEIREFEYIDKPDICPRCKSSPSEAHGSTEELLILASFVEMLFTDSLLQQEDNILAETSLKKYKTDDESCSHIKEALLDGTGTSLQAINGLLEMLLKDKLYQWLSIKSKCNDQVSSFLSKKEQGVIHTVAALGFVWALSPVLSCGVGINFRDINGWTALHWAARFGREKMVAALIASGASAGAVTDPTAHDQIGKTAASIAALNGHNGLAGYLSELSLTSHLSSLTLEESKFSRDSAEAEAERTVASITTDHQLCINEDELSLKDTLAAARNAAQAAARIQSAFREHSFRKRLIMSKQSSQNSRDHNSAALFIQKKYRGWKGRKDFLALRKKVVRIQAHVRGYQVRKQYKILCWAVRILDKVILKWKRKGPGLKSLPHETEVAEDSEEDEDYLKVFRKHKVDEAIREALSRVLSMVHAPAARQQYRRMLERYRQAKAELDSTTFGEAASSNSPPLLDMDNEEYAYPFPWH